MNVGGYQIIDFTGKNIGYELPPVKCAGIYESIEGTSKPILITGLTLDMSSTPMQTTLEIRNMFKSPQIDGSKYRIKLIAGEDFKSNESIDAIFIDIDDDDFVTVMA